MLAHFGPSSLLLARDFIFQIGFLSKHSGNQESVFEKTTWSVL